MNNSNSDSYVPILELDTSVIRQRFQNNNLSFGFSSAQFLGNSLNLLCAFSRQHKVEVFDLEMVDEASCAPVKSFDLSAAIKGDVLSTERPFATCVAAISETVGVAGLSNGLMATLDTRQRVPSLFKQNRRAPFILGENNLYRHDSVAITALSIYDEQCILTGSKNGTVCVWDRRNTRDYLSNSTMKSTIGSILPYVPPYRNGSPLFWVNDFSGELAAMCLGADALHRIASVQTGDGKRRASHQAIPTPKISILQPEGVLLMPHISTNSVYYYDVAAMHQSNVTDMEDEPESTVKLLHAHQFEDNEICAGFFNSTYRLLFLGDAHGKRAFHYLNL
ncbi:hypothetical protein STCU_03209 [Strigomonas culicis]|uniref:Guanine nucleotide-binding protein subunit beta-like protein n=1 Tax=Strigomonas culicis TaxID=28005 RepID=S9VXM8_9TRYP|nr:hypothetical protein STCU_03209 [Strigomonas culicis]|eukprot:EPY31816.1 hypothetical protein STCU_03209 [Strigomonas culicis]